MSNTESPNPAAVRRCQQVKIDGVRCGSPAIKNQRLCYFHEMQLRARPENRASIDPYDVYIDIPVLENDASIQVAITHIIRLLLCREIDHRTAALVLYGLQTSAAIARRGPIEPDPADVVSDFRQLYDLPPHKEDSAGKQGSADAAKPEAVAPSAPASANKSPETASDNAAAQPPKKPPVNSSSRVPDNDSVSCPERIMPTEEKARAATTKPLGPDPTPPSCSKQRVEDGPPTSPTEEKHYSFEELLQFNSDKVEYRPPFCYLKQHPDQPLCPKCFAEQFAVRMGEPGEGCEAGYRRCELCKSTIKDPSADGGQHVSSSGVVP